METLILSQASLNILVMSFCGSQKILDNLGMLSGEIKSLRWVTGEIEEQRRFMFLKFDWHPGAAITGRRLEMGLESAFANRKQISAPIIINCIAQALSLLKQNWRQIDPVNGTLFWHLRSRQVETGIKQ